MRLLVLGLLVIAGCASDPKIIKECSACDIDGNGKVNAEADFEAFQDALGSSDFDDDYNVRADFDVNGYVNTLDYAVYVNVCADEEKD